MFPAQNDEQGQSGFSPDGKLFPSGVSIRAFRVSRRHGRTPRQLSTLTTGAVLQPDQAVGFGSILGTLLLIVYGLWRSIRTSNIVKADVAQFQASNDHLREELNKALLDLEAAKRSSRERDERIDSLTERLRQAELSSREVERTNANLTGRLTEQREIFTRQLSDQANQIIQLNVTLNQRNDEVKELKQSLTQKETQLQRANETITRLDQELIVEREARQDLQKRIEALESQVRTLMAEREQIIRERDEALAKLAERDAEIARLERELATLRARLEREQTPADNQKSASAEIATAEPEAKP